MRATVITDASFKITEGRKTFAGWATWIRIDSDNGHPFKAYGTFKNDVPDSSTAEVLAALNGMWYAAINGATMILVRSDNMLVTHLIKGNKKVQQRFQDLWSEAMRNPDFRNVVHFDARHVKGHQEWNTAAASWVNRWCDERCKIARIAHEQGKSLLWKNR